MFYKNNQNNATKAPVVKKDNIPSIITKDVNVLGNIISEGNIDFDGTLNGNIRCDMLTIRTNGHVKGEVVANSVQVYGVVKGLIRAKNVQLFASCNVEGIIMHETVSIEDGATVDGKFKRTDRVKPEDEQDYSSSAFWLDEDTSAPETKVLENIRLIS